MKGRTTGFASGLFGAYTGARRVFKSWAESEGIQPKELFKMRTRGRKNYQPPRRRRQLQQFSNDYTAEYINLGRKPRKNVKQLWKLQRASEGTNVFGYSEYSPYGGTQGAIQLANVAASLATGVPLEAPVHLWEVTAAPNVNAGTGVYPTIRNVLKFTGGAIPFTSTWTQDKTIQQINLSATATAFDSFPNNKSILEWASFKLLFYAPTSLATKINVQLVQFLDDRLVPGAAQTTFGDAFWEAMSKPYMTNPLETGGGIFSRYVKVWYNNSFAIDPKESTEAVNTKIHQLNVFKRFNRLCRYDWNQDASMLPVNTTNVTSATANATQLNVNDNQVTVLPKARIYLMIRGFAKYSTGFAPAQMPSYDIVYRKKHVHTN